MRVPDSVDLTRAFRRYPELIAAGLLYNAAIAVDRIVFWVASTGRPIVGWFHASIYDTPIFLCYLSVVPSLAIFLVSVETDFYDRYREYYGVATKHGTLRQVLEAKRAMTECLRDSLRRLLVAQAPVTLLLMALAPWIARRARARPAAGCDPPLRARGGAAARAVPLRRHRAALLRPPPRRRRGRAVFLAPTPPHRRHPAASAPAPTASGIRSPRCSAARGPTTGSSRPWTTSST